MRTLQRVFVLISAGLLSGCAGQAPFIETGEVRSLVIGYIDMEQAPSDLDWLALRQVAPPTDAPYWRTWVKDGIFYHHNIPAGSYQISGFGGSGWNTSYEYDVPRQTGADMRLSTREPGIYFIGSFEYREIDTAWYKPDAYDLVRTDSPTEREILEQLLPEAEDTSWGPRIRRRLEELGQ